MTVRVRPGSSRVAVGGRYAEHCLVVAVTSPAVDGRATRAVVEALAHAFGVRARQVQVISGERSRTKIVEIEGDERVLSTRFVELMGPEPPTGTH